VLKDYPELRETSRIGLVESLRTVVLTLWDEQQKRLVSFRAAKAGAR
jgi:omega-6 fatty acid desaturase (delta-12 desaturase)